VAAQGGAAPRPPSGASGPASGTTFAAELRRLRLRAGLTQEALAERAGVSVATIGAIEEGQRRRPYPHTVAALLDALDLTPGDRTALLEVAVPTARPAPSTARPAPNPGPAPARDAIEPGAPAGALPVPPTVLIGRDAELAGAVALLCPPAPAAPAVRLLTLVGPGGVGKSRLAVAIATAVQDAYPAGVVFVDLAPVGDHRLVPATIARTLHIHETGGRSARQLLLRHLRAWQGLLVLDNFEHLLAAAPLLAELLASCPRLVLLVTSRTALQLRAEQRFPVTPLATPAANPTLALDAIAAAPAVQLFVERARAVAPGFELEGATATAVAAVSRRLDGLPLALELAAVWVPVLPPAVLLERLERRLHTLTGGVADLPTRQQTLRHTLDWSHDLLGDTEQALYRRLAVFAGGWTLEGAEAVCAAADVPAGEVLALLVTLGENSLVRRVDQGEQPEPRFGMLETIREDALERLHDADEAAAVRHRHLEFFLALAETAEPHLHNPEQAAWADRLEREHDNLRAALEWAAQSGAADLELRLASTLRYFWYLRGYHREGRDRLLAALTHADASRSTPDRARALNAVGFLEAIQGDSAAARAHLDEGVALGRQLSDAEVVAFGLRYRGLVALAQRDDVAAATALEESLTLCRQLERPVEVAEVLMYLGDTALQQGNLDRAGQLFHESRQLLERLQKPKVLPYPVRRLGQLALLRGDHPEALQRCLESLRLNREVDDPQGVAASLVGLAAVAAAGRQDVTAAQLLGAADAVLTATSTQLFPFDHDQQQRMAAEVRARLDPVSLSSAWERGRHLPIDETVALLVAGG
jgi:predicted ATPase/transcriptional regulator with XRE-family HTH domain